MISALIIEKLIKIYDMKPHVEGGYSSLLFEDAGLIPGSVLPNEFQGKDRPYWNGIYYLLTANDRSIFHKIRMTELWNFYLGGPLDIFQISPEGDFQQITLGKDVFNAQKFTHVFPKGYWIGAKPGKGTDFSFVSCITAPGFYFDDWEKASKESLLKLCPQASKTIKLLTD